MKNLAETIFVFFILVLIAILSTSAHADNDDLAFDFVNSEPSVIIAVEQCYVSGFYTFEQSQAIKDTDAIYNYSYDDYYNLGDFCQEVHEEIFPREYKENKLIREMVK